MNKANTTIKNASNEYLSRRMKYVRCSLPPCAPAIIRLYSERSCSRHSFKRAF